MTKIKICGIRRPQDVTYINEAMPDYAGFVFAPNSRRYISPCDAANLRSNIHPRIVTVGVFQDAEHGLIAGLVNSKVIGAVQLHGSENTDYAAEIKRLSVPVIKAVSVKDENSFGSFPADFLLFDNGSGGTGETFELGLMDKAREMGKFTQMPFFIAGGINETNIAEALKRKPYGIDVSSGSETGGVKDGDKIRRLVQTVHSYSEKGAENV